MSTSTGMQAERQPEELIEELAGAVMAAELEDESSLAPIVAGLEALEEALDAGRQAEVREQARSLRERVEGILGQACDDPQAQLERICREVSELQERLSQPGGSEPVDAPSSGSFVLPEWVDDSIFQDFVAGHEIVLDEIESDMLALEKGKSGASSSLRGRIHTLKGEAGLLGLEGVEGVCHELEDYLDSGDRTAMTVDHLLSVKDWLAEAIAAYARGELPEKEAGDVLAELHGVSGTEGADEEATDSPETARESELPEVEILEVETPDAEPEAADEGRAEHPAAAPQAAAWDDDNREVAAEFLQESEEGLTRVDEILLGAEREGVAGEDVDAMFRVFHTIKGVAGFLDLAEITELAHTTENLLDKARQGSLEIEGAVFDVLFDATEMMRRMLVDLREAISEDVHPGSEAGLPDLIRRLKSIIEGHREEEELPPAERGERLGEILTRPPPEVAPEAIEACVESQAQTGRRLGEELVAQGKAKPKQVSQGLRAQSGKGDAKAAKLKEVVKVDLERVDNLVSLIGELVIVEAMIANAPELTGHTSPRLRKNVSQMSKITKDLQDIGTRMRTVPVRGVFQKMARMVRDLSRKSGKAIGAEMTGEGTEMDRSMVEQIADPLVHMIRNAVDHGVEGKEERQQAGKPARGTIGLHARHQGGSVVIEVTDDGRGLDRDAILAKARSRGVVKEGDSLSDREIYNLIFEPGFSTAKQVTEISGRGVGMDVVRRNVESIRGRVEIDSVPGQGSTFTMVLPLTLAIIDGMLTTCGAERFIIPTLSVVESINPESSMIFSIIGKGEILQVRGETIPLLRLDRLLHVPDAVQDPTQALVVVVESRGKKIGLLVDDVLTQQQVVIKGLGDGLPGTRYLSGAAILSDGRVGLILSTDHIVELIDEDTFRALRNGALPATACAEATDRDTDTHPIGAQSGLA